MDRKVKRTRKVIGDTGWIIGFCLSYGIFSTAFHFIFSRENSYAVSMLLTGGILLAGEGIRRWSRE